MVRLVPVLLPACAQCCKVGKQERVDSDGPCLDRGKPLVLVALTALCTSANGRYCSGVRASKNVGPSLLAATCHREGPRQVVTRSAWRTGGWRRQWTIIRTPGCPWRLWPTALCRRPGSFCARYLLAPGDKQELVKEILFDSVMQVLQGFGCCAMECLCMRWYGGGLPASDARPGPKLQGQKRMCCWEHQSTTTAAFVSRVQSLAGRNSQNP